MDKVRRDGDAKRTNEVIRSNLLTRDVGILCSDLVPMNDKCVMVGTTGIAALKAEYGDDFTNFEIIQDIGYSSESSTHLSGDDGVGVGGPRYYNIRVYNYNASKPPPKTCINLKDELETADSKKLTSLGSSLGSSSVATSFEDSGLGISDLRVLDEQSLSTKDEIILSGQRSDGEMFEEDEVTCLPGEESDFLESVLQSCTPFSDAADDSTGERVAEEMHFTLSGLESDDPSDDFHNRSSFTTSAHAFYKMISVDSDNGEADLRAAENSGQKDIPTHSAGQTKFESKPKVLSATFIAPSEKSTSRKSPRSDSEPEIYTPSASLGCRNSAQKYQKTRTSTPICHHPDSRLNETNHHQNLKRKRDSDTTDFATTWQGGGRTTNNVNSWLRRCAKYSDTVLASRSRRALFRENRGHSSSDDCKQPTLPLYFDEDMSSCDASCEYTSSSADEGNAFSSSSSFFEGDGFQFKTCVNSYSAEGSVETVVCSQRTMTNAVENTLLSLAPPSTMRPYVCGKRGKENSLCHDYDQYDNESSGGHGRTIPKASSEGDVKMLFSRKNTPEYALTKISAGCPRKKSTPFSDLKQRLSSSLPNVLRHHNDSSTEDFKESTSDARTPKYRTTEPLNAVSHNHSSLSDFGRRKRRRSRKKSSSSSRSSRSIAFSGDSCRHRSRTLTTLTTSTISLSSGRPRNFSQRSDCLRESEVNLFSEEKMRNSEVTLLEKDLQDVELDLALESDVRRDSSVLPSPVESDVVLTQFEEQSTVSDQVWDGYQEMPYLSEAYSETTVDEDAIRKLTEFGDDYGSAIGLPLRILDSADNNNKTEPKSPFKKSTKSVPLSSHQRLSILSHDTDSDTEDLHHLMAETKKALHFAQATLIERQLDESTDHAELLATCGTHSRCLQAICEHISIDGKENSFTNKDLKQLHFLIEEWEVLQKSLEMYQTSEDHTREKYLKAQENLDALFNKMSELSSLTHLDTKSFNTWEDLESNMVRLQMVLVTLQETKERLLEVNLQVHRFMTEYGSESSYKGCSLKEDVTELYKEWEDIYEENGAQLTELETLKSRWVAFEGKLETLQAKVKDVAVSSSQVDCDNTCLTSGEKPSFDLQKELQELMYDAGFLECRLKGGPLWKTIERDIRDIGERIDKQTRTTPASRSDVHPNSSVPVEDDVDDHFEDANPLPSCDTRACKSSGSHAKGKVDVTASRPSRFWRVVRVAVPVQLALVLLYCLACCLEPNCCDMLNNYNFSLTPQLRYLSGRPPV